MKSTTDTLIEAMQILSREIHSDDGIANAAILEASERLKEQDKRIAELEKENKMLDECSNRNDVSNFDLLAEASNKIAELQEENSFLKGLRMIAAITSDEKEPILKKRIAELEEVLQKLHKLGGLGLDKHKWIEDVLKGGDL